MQGEAVAEPELVNLESDRVAHFATHKVREGILQTP